MIRLATINDAEAIQQAYLAMLEDLQPFGCEQAATQENARQFWATIFLPAIAWEKHAILLAEADGKVIGAIFWVLLNSALKTNQLTAIGYGTWVSTEHRRKGLSARLRDEAVKQLKALGVVEVMGHVLANNQAGIDSALKAGFEISGLVLKMKLSDQVNKTPLATTVTETSSD